MVWSGFYGVYGRLFERAGSPQGRARSLSRLLAFDPLDVAIRRRANSWWRRSATTVSGRRSRSRPGGSHLGGFEIDDLGGFRDKDPPELAINATGDYLVVWTRNAGGRAARPGHGAAFTNEGPADARVRDLDQSLVLQSSPSCCDGPRRLLRGGVGERGPGRAWRGHFRPALRLAGRTTRRRVSGQHRDLDRQSDPAVAIDDDGTVLRGMDQPRSGWLGGRCVRTVLRRRSSGGKPRFKSTSDSGITAAPPWPWPPMRRSWRCGKAHRWKAVGTTSSPESSRRERWMRRQRWRRRS